MTSSVIPSAKNSFSGLGLRFRNGSTATEGARSPGDPSVRAAANSAAELWRSAGEAAIALSRADSTEAGTAARSRRIRGTGSVKRFTMTRWGLRPV